MQILFLQLKLFALMPINNAKITNPQYGVFL